MIHISSERVQEIVKRFPKTKVLVIGDVMLDEFIWGKVNRISPEAPVPIVEVSSRSVMPGGAANVVSNIRSLGAQAALIGICGEDIHGRVLRESLDSIGANTDGLIADKGRSTTLKSRIIAHQQQVVRVDEESKNGHHPHLLAQMIQLLESKIDEVEVILVQDYNKGVVEQALIEKILSLAKEKNKVKNILN